MGSRDVVVVGAGLIGVAIARELRAAGLRVTVLERGQAGREASWAGAGMLAAWQTVDARLRPAAIASAEMYPEYVAELEAATGLACGYEACGTIRLSLPDEVPQAGWEELDAFALAKAEPRMRPPEGVRAWRVAGDHSVDNRALMTALVADARRMGVEIREHCAVVSVAGTGGGMETAAGGETFASAVVVNAAGAWTSGIAAPVAVRIRPRKGQMLACAATSAGAVIAAPGVYVVPRGGRTLVGATLEDNGFATGCEAEALAALRLRAVALYPHLAGADASECWYGFRPGSEDGLPVVGRAAPGYWVASGHYRDGILLTPWTAKTVAAAMLGGEARHSLRGAPPQVTRSAGFDIRRRMPAGAQGIRKFPPDAKGASEALAPFDPMR